MDSAHRARSPAQMALAEGVGRDQEAGPVPSHPHLPPPARSPRLVAAARVSQKLQKGHAAAATGAGRPTAVTASSTGQHGDRSVVNTTVRSSFTTFYDFDSIIGALHIKISTEMLC